MACITKRGNSWLVRVKYQNRRKTKSFPILEQAERWAELMSEEIKAKPVPYIEFAITARELKRLYSKSVERAKVSGQLHTLTYSDFMEAWVRAAGHCSVSGIPFSSTPREGCTRRPFFPSLDRIDNALGYVPGNVRFVCIIANIARADFGDALLLELARAIVMNNTIPDRFGALEKPYIFCNSPQKSPLKVEDPLIPSSADLTWCPEEDL